VVTNWDATTWLAGSFYAATTASGAAPVAGHAFAGVVYYANATDFVLQAVDLTDANHPQFIRVMSGGVWGAWAADDASVYVKKSGDTMTGDLTINSAFLTVSAAVPSLNLTKAASGNASGIMSRLGAALRWIILPGDTTAESGANVGSDFVVQGYTDAGSPVTPPAVTIKRALNRLLLAGDPVAALDAATKQYTDAGDTALAATNTTQDTAIANRVRYDAAQGLTVPQKAQARANTATPLRGWIAGLTLSTAGASTTFTVAAGEAADSTTSDLMQLAASLAKTTAAWAVGAAGALDTGSIATNTWYHVYLIKRPDTGVVDVLLSTNATTPTLLPTNYTLFRRIGSMRTNASSQWTLFLQIGDEFIWDTPPIDISASGLGAVSTLFALTVPLGVSVLARVRYQIGTTSGTMVLLLQSPLITTQSVAGGYNVAVTTLAGVGSAGEAMVLTNTAQQIRAVANASGGTQATYLGTWGWFDTRGRFA
jgi:hypothetical protein